MTHSTIINELVISVVKKRATTTRNTVTTINEHYSIMVIDSIYINLRTNCLTWKNLWTLRFDYYY